MKMWNSVLISLTYFSLFFITTYTNICKAVRNILEEEEEVNLHMKQNSQHSSWIKTMRISSEKKIFKIYFLIVLSIMHIVHFNIIFLSYSKGEVLHRSHLHSHYHRHISSMAGYRHDFYIQTAWADSMYH